MVEAKYPMSTIVTDVERPVSLTVNMCIKIFVEKYWMEMLPELSK